MLSIGIRKLPLALLAIGMLLAVNASAALAAPTVTTLVATEAAGTSATLNGTVAAASGHVTEYDFGYGLTSNVSEFTGSTPVEYTSSQSPVEVIAPITGLEPETTYYYAIAAVDTVTKEVSVGKVRSFKTTANDGIRFRAVEYPANVGGSLSNETVFEADEGGFKVDCGTRNMSGSLSGSTTSLSLLPELSSCSSNLGATTVKMNSCRYVANVTGTFAPEFYKGNVTVSCSKEGDAIEYSVPSAGCTLYMGTQGGSSTNLGAKNAGTAADRHVELAGSKAVNWTSKYAFLCGLAGIPASGSDGLVSADATLKGTNSSGAYTEFYVAG